MVTMQQLSYSAIHQGIYCLLSGHQDTPSTAVTLTQFSHSMVTSNTASPGTSNTAWWSPGHTFIIGQHDTSHSVITRAQPHTQWSPGHTLITRWSPGHISMACISHVVVGHNFLTWWSPGQTFLTRLSSRRIFFTRWSCISHLMVTIIMHFSYLVVARHLSDQVVTSGHMSHSALRGK